MFPRMAFVRRFFKSCFKVLHLVQLLYRCHKVLSSLHKWSCLQKIRTTFLSLFKHSRQERFFQQPKDVATFLENVSQPGGSPAQASADWGNLSMSCFAYICGHMLNLWDEWYKVSVKIKLGKDNFSFSLGSGWRKPWATDRLQHTFTDGKYINKQSPFEPKSWNILIEIMHLYQLHLWNTIQLCFQGIQGEQWTSPVLHRLLFSSTCV